jgi:hypothetical protein
MTYRARIFSPPACEISLTELIAGEKLFPFIYARTYSRFRQHIKARFFDACNLAILRNLVNEDDRFVRMLSSGRRFNEAAHRLLGSRAPIRSICEWAYLTHLYGDFKSMKTIELLQGLQKTSSRILHHRLKSEAVTGWQIENWPALGTFMDFAPYYRNVLKPVDDMIIAASRSIPRVKISRMREFYAFITREARIVDGFRAWWERIATMLSSIDTMLGGHDGYSALKQQHEKPRHPTD